MKSLLQRGRSFNRKPKQIMGLVLVWFFLFSFSFFPKLAANSLLRTSSLLKPHMLPGGWRLAGHPLNLLSVFTSHFQGLSEIVIQGEKTEKTQAATSKSQASGPVSVRPAFLSRGIGLFPAAARSRASLQEEQCPWLPPGDARSPPARCDNQNTSPDKRPWARRSLPAENS